MKNLAILFCLLFSLSCQTTDNNDTNSIANYEIAVNNNCLKDNIELIYNYIDVEYGKYPIKVNNWKKKSDLLKSSTNEIVKIISEMEDNQDLSKSELLSERISNYIKIIQDSIFPNSKEGESLKNQIIPILNVEKFKSSTIIKNNVPIIVNKILLSENILAEYLKRSIYINDFHFNKIQAVVCPLNSKFKIKLGEEFKANILLSTVDSSFVNPLFVVSEFKGWEQLSHENNSITLNTLKNKNHPYFIKKSNQIVDTLEYEGDQYIYTAKPQKKGIFRLGGYMQIFGRDSFEIINIPFEGKYIVE